MRPILIAGLCAGLAGPVAADCVSLENLEGQGIEVRFQSGLSEVFRRARDGNVDVRGREADGYTYRYLLGHGLHLLEDVPTQNGADVPSEMIRFAFAEGEMPRPIPGTDWNGNVAVIQKDGTSEETQQHVFGQIQSAVIEGCSYDTFVVSSTYSENGEVFFFEELLYFPQLEFGAVRYVRDSTGDTSSFQITQLNAVP